MLPAAAPVPAANAAAKPVNKSSLFGDDEESDSFGTAPSKAEPAKPVAKIGGTSLFDDDSAADSSALFGKPAAQADKLAQSAPQPVDDKKCRFQRFFNMANAYVMKLCFLRCACF